MRWHCWLNFLHDAKQKLMKMKEYIFYSSFHFALSSYPPPIVCDGDGGGVGGILLPLLCSCLYTDVCEERI